MKKNFLLTCLIGLLTSLIVGGAVAQDGTPRIQEFYSVVSPENEFVYFDLFGMEAGTTIYLYVESDEIDTALFLCDIDCEETFAENDDIDVDGGNYNSALEFTFVQGGDYSIAIADCCEPDVTGVFRLLIGYDAPALLTGSAFPTGARIAIPYEPTYTDLTVASNTVSGEAQVQQFIGTIGEDTPLTYYDIFGATAGETLYAYVSSTEIDPYLIICDINCEEIFAENDDIDLDAGDTNSALEFTFPADGDYSIAIADCCDETTVGSFRLLLGYDAPAVLTGTAAPTGATIAEAYQVNRATTTDIEVERVGTSDCSSIELRERPQLSGEMLQIESENFVVHYTREGDDSATDEYAQAVLDHLELTLTEHLAMGWPLPPSDCGEGGDARFDLYLSDVLGAEGFLGTAAPEAILGDNVNSPAVEEWAAYSHMTVDNDFAGTPNPMVTMRATVDHEFNHAVQFGYDINDAADWVYEATASWVETTVNTADEDASGYAIALFELSDMCLGSLADEDGLRVYGEWLLIDSIAQDHGNEAIITMWESFADYEDNEAYFQFLSSLGTTPQDVLRRHAVRNLTLDYRLAGQFAATIRVEAVADGVGTVTPQDNGIQQLGVDYVLLRRKGLFNLSIDQPNLNLIIVGIDQLAESATVFDLGSGGVVDITGYTYAYAIILNTDQNADASSCTTTDWVLTIEDAAGATPSEGNGEIFNAVNFVPAG